MLLKKIIFIVNPNAGNKKHQITQELVSKYFFLVEYELLIWYTEYPKHAILLAKNALEINPYCIVACGGDGTINEVASSLVNTNILFGIIPVGSGNGLASHLSISKNINIALETISKFKIQKIDVGKVNEYFFFSNMGFGFDATVVENFNKSQKRKLSGYLMATLKAFKEYKCSTYTIVESAALTKICPFLFFVSNSNEMGYGLSLTPNARLNDGFLNAFIVEKISVLKQLWLGVLLVSKKIQNCGFIEEKIISEFTIKSNKKTFKIQIDGEFHKINSEYLNIALVHNGLTVIIPTQF